MDCDEEKTRSDPTGNEGIPVEPAARAVWVMTSLVNRVGVDTLDDLTFAASTISSNLRRAAAAAVRSIDSGHRRSRALSRP